MIEDYQAKRRRSRRLSRLLLALGFLVALLAAAGTYLYTTRSEGPVAAVPTGINAGVSITP